MVFTSYFANIPKLIEAGFDPATELCGIVRKRPFWLRREVRNVPALAPSEWLLETYKAGKIDESVYTACYRGGLEKLNVKDTIATIKSIGLKVFLCYEAPDKFCHRHLFADWLTAGGLDCKEWTPERWKALQNPRLASVPVGAPVPLF